MAGSLGKDPKGSIKSFRNLSRGFFKLYCALVLLAQSESIRLRKKTWKVHKLHNSRMSSNKVERLQPTRVESLVTPPGILERPSERLLCRAELYLGGRLL